MEEFTYLSSERCVNTDISQRQPLVNAYWERMDPNYRDGAGAESFHNLRTRAKSLHVKALDWTGLTFVFTHEQFIRAVILETISGETPDFTQMQRFFALRSGLPIPNGAIIRLDHREHSWWLGAIDTSHLFNSVSPSSNVGSVSSLV